jgi:hypothetical protein
VKPAFNKYAAAVIEHDVTGVAILKASDDELGTLFDQMHVALTHKIELREAVAAWRVKPEQVRCTTHCHCCRPFPPPHTRPLSRVQAMQAIERQRKVEEQRKSEDAASGWLLALMIFKRHASCRDFQCYTLQSALAQ